jgi:hypothetical protein
MSTTTRFTLPQDGSPQISSSSDDSHSSSSESWASTDSGSTSSWPPQRHVSPLASSLEQSSTDDSEYHPSSQDQSSTDESHPPTPGSTDSQPLPASPSNSGSSTEPNPPPSAKRPRPEEDELGSSLTKILKGKFKFKRRFSGSGASNAAQGDMQGTFNSRAYVTAPSLSR